MNTKIWLSSPHMGGSEQKYVQEAFDTNWVAPLGPNVNEFENSLEVCIGENSKVAALSSGTAALHLALIQAGVQRNDIVLCQSFTFSASANPIAYQGAIPVFIDSEKETWNMCPELLEKAIKESIAEAKKPKAIIVVHLYGMPAKMEAIKKVASTYEIAIIEDAAEALGSTLDSQQCGSFGDFAILSFNGNKIITTSGGGALICKDEVSKNNAIFLATQARDQAPHYQHSEIGYNYRMSNIVAGIGRGQLEVLDERVAARRRNFEFYKKTFIAIAEIQFLEEPEGYFSNRWLTCIVTPSFEIREKIRIGLEGENIEARPLWKPMHQQPVFKDCKAYVNGVSNDLFEKGLCLPSGSNLTEEDLLRVANCIKELISS